MAESNIDLQERWWVEKSRKNFLAYRMFLRAGQFKHNWFIHSLTAALQKFYIDYKAGKRPILIISCPPQHGKSWAVEDLISWIAGQDPDCRMVYASFSDYLGKRCNSANQRVFDSEKYKKIFPKTWVSSKDCDEVVRGTYMKNSNLVEFINRCGSLRNTTVGGPITGESLDIGFIDDPFKGRQEANSPVTRDTVWNWFTDDFGTRHSDPAGYVITMTRWHIDDIVGRLLEKLDDPDRVTVFKYAAIAEEQEQFRAKGEALFPELKSLEFLLGKKAIMLDQAWQSLYQGSPITVGGNLIDNAWWNWWERLPQMAFTYAVADTAQKTNNWNDYTVFQHWGKGVDGNVYLLNMFYDRVKAPDLRRQAEIFYRSANHARYGGPFRGFLIEDKSSGTGLIQELQEKKFKVIPIPRTTDKVTRAFDTGPEIRAGKVFLNAAIPYVNKITEEAVIFPNGKNDDAFDCTMNGIEVAYIYSELLNNTIFVG